MAPTHDEMMTTARALAESRVERGQFLTDAEQFALVHNSRFGSDSYPVRKLSGGRWTLEHPVAKGTPLYRTKRDAVAAWELLICILIRVKGLTAENR